MPTEFDGRPPPAPAMTLSPASLTSSRVRLRTGVKVVLLALALLLVLVPRNRVSPLAYPLLFGVPLVYAATRREAERAFLLWTTYTVSFATFILLRRLADDTGVPWLHQYVIAIDRAVGLGAIPTVLFQRLWYSAAAPTPLDAMTIGFHLSYYLVPPAAGIVLWCLNRAVFERYLLAIAATYILGLLAHFILPTMPPWMAGSLGYIEPVARVLYERVHTAWPGFYAFGNALAGGNDVAAMPSLHMATASLVALAFGRIGRRMAVPGVLYAIGMGFSLVYTGEHYVADLLGGGAIAWLCWRAAPGALARLLPSTAAPLSSRLPTADR